MTSNGLLLLRKALDLSIFFERLKKSLKHNPRPATERAELDEAHSPRGQIKVSAMTRLQKLL